MNTSKIRNQSRWRWQWRAAIVVAALLGLTACRTTQQVSQDPKDFSGFLGNYSALQRGEKGEANYLYIDASAPWGHYTKIYVRPVELWKSDAADSALSRLSPQNQQLLVDYFHTALLNALEKKYQVVNYAGPDVLVIHAAVTDARKSQPVLNLVSSVLPVGMAASFTKQLITGTGAGVGLVMMEADFLDGQTGQRVAAVVDARAGTKAVRTKFNSTWGDVKLAFDWWAQRLVGRLQLIQKGDFSTEQL